jgi:hypothetical protein
MVSSGMRKSRVVVAMMRRCPGATKQGQKAQLCRTKPHEVLLQVRAEANRVLVVAGSYFQSLFGVQGVVLLRHASHCHKFSLACVFEFCACRLKMTSLGASWFCHWWVSCLVQVQRVDNDVLAVDATFYPYRYLPP